MKKILKLFVSVILIFTLSLGLFSCGGSGPSAETFEKALDKKIDKADTKDLPMKLYRPYI